MTDDTLFESKLNKWYKETPRDLLTLIRQAVNPWQEFSEITEKCNSWMMKRLDDGCEVDSDFTEPYFEWVNTAQDLLDTLHATSEEQSERNHQDRWYSIPDPNLQPWDFGYSARQFRADVRGDDKPVFVEPVGNSRLSDKRVEAGVNPDMWFVTEFGNLNVKSTSAYHSSLLRIRAYKAPRTHNDCISIGGVEVDFTAQRVQCRVYGCKHKGYIPDTEDREEQEFFILRIFYHLGSHYAGGFNQFPKFLAPPSRFRDVDAMRWYNRGVVKRAQIQALTK